MLRRIFSYILMGPSVVVAPSELSYTTPLSVNEDSPITPLSPTISGTSPFEYTVDPALPTGLVINSTTGIISGTPTTATASAEYTVTATNSAGFTTFGIDIEIIEASFWTSLTSMTANASTNALTKVGIDNSFGDAGASSETTIASGAAGSIEFLLPAAPWPGAVGQLSASMGLTEVFVGNTSTSIQWAIDVNTYIGSVRARENGTPVADTAIPTLDGSVTIKVNKAADGTVTYLVNGVVFHTSAVSAAGKVIFPAVVGFANGLCFTSATYSESP